MQDLEKIYININFCSETNRFYQKVLKFTLFNSTKNHWYDTFVILIRRVELGMIYSYLKSFT